jgi:hypothetical protein
LGLTATDADRGPSARSARVGQLSLPIRQSTGWVHATNGRGDPRDEMCALSRASCSCAPAVVLTRAAVRGAPAASCIALLILKISSLCTRWTSKRMSVCRWVGPLQWAAGSTKPAPVGFSGKPSGKPVKPRGLSVLFFLRVGWTGRNPGKSVFFFYRVGVVFAKTERFFDIVNPSGQW